MIVVNIMGGLGNQMFQYACGQAVGAMTGQEVRYTVDTVGSFTTSRALELERVFGLDLPIAQYPNLADIIGAWRANPKVRRLLARPEASALRGKRFIAEQRFAVIPDLSARAAAGAYLHGYWQSSRYFEAIADQVRRSFTFQEEPALSDRQVLTRITRERSIGVHVRRGDYVAQPAASAAHGVLPPQYFFDAVTHLRLEMPDARVFAFSDDPAWVEKTLLQKIGNSECVRHNYGDSSFRDMQLMAQCDGLVISNSTFSWWAAWLSDRPGTSIIAPKNWFADHRLDASAIVPNTWLRM